MGYRHHGTSSHGEKDKHTNRPVETVTGIGRLKNQLAVHKRETTDAFCFVFNRLPSEETLDYLLPTRLLQNVFFRLYRY